MTNSNKLTAAHIAAVVEAYAARQDAPHFARLAANGDIAEADYNLSVSTWVEAEDTREAVDIVALNAEIAAIVARGQALREAIDETIAEIEVGG